MKIKMVKMGSDIDETRNYRIRGIVPTSDEKYLFIEIMLGHRPDIKYTNLSNSEYKKEYPHEEYVWISSCFRVDIPKDYRYSSSPEFSEYNYKHFHELAHTKSNIVKVLQIFNTDIEDIELTDDYYLDKYCEEKGFFEMYDKRLKHITEPTEIIVFPFRKESKARVKMQYTCYASNGTKCSDELQEFITVEDLVKQYGKNKIQELAYSFIERRCSNIEDLQEREKYRKNKQEAFCEVIKEIEQTNNLQKAAEIDELYDLDY